MHRATSKAIVRDASMLCDAYDRVVLRAHGTQPLVRAFKLLNDIWLDNCVRNSGIRALLLVQCADGDDDLVSVL